MSVSVQVLRRNNALIGWLAFVSQVLVAISVEIGDEFGRALFSQHGTVEGVDNARRIVDFELAHGFFMEPAWQMFFERTHHVLMISITWSESARVMNGIYVLGHVFVTLGVACWMFFYRRSLFPLFRNALILVNVFALVVYEHFPTAPPRLTGPLTYNHHTFVFQDTLFGIVNAAGKTVGTEAGFNEFSAMPSIHMGWALIVGLAIVIAGRPMAVKGLGLLYPALMLLAIVVTGNHYLLDAGVATLLVVLAFVVAGSFAWWRGRYRGPHLFERQTGQSAP